MTTYVTDDEGKFIPATQRPDGTWRKARRVKEGYVPQEEVPLYESKGKQFANRKSEIPTGVSPPADINYKKEKAKKKKGALPPGVIVLPKNSTNAVPRSSSVPKNSQNEQASSVSTNSAQIELETVPCVVDTPAMDNATANVTLTENAVVIEATIESITKDLWDVELEEQQLEFSKKVKKLKKKIREIEAIEAKLKGGDLKKPEKDQLDKVKRKREYLKELEELELQGATD